MPLRGDSACMSMTLRTASSTQWNRCGSPIGARTYDPHFLLRQDGRPHVCAARHALCQSIERGEDWAARLRWLLADGADPRGAALYRQGGIGRYQVSRFGAD